MQDIIEAIIHKAPVQGLTVHIGKSGLCLGDAANLRLLPDGHVGVFCVARQRRLIFSQRIERRIGNLGPHASAIVTPALTDGDPLRVRIVGLTPEHLAHDGQADVHVSVWGHARRLPHIAAAAPQEDDLQDRQESDGAPPPTPAPKRRRG